MRYGVESSWTLASGIQAVEPFGRWGSRTRTQPGRELMTGSTDRDPYQLSGTQPIRVPPGVAYRPVVPCSAASKVTPGGRVTPEKEPPAATGGVAGRTCACDCAGGGVRPPPFPASTR